MARWTNILSYWAAIDGGSLQNLSFFTSFQTRVLKNTQGVTWCGFIFIGEKLAGIVAGQWLKKTQNNWGGLNECLMGFRSLRVFFHFIYAVQVVSKNIATG